MVKISNFSNELESEMITVYLYKKHITHLKEINKQTKKTVSQQIRDMIDKDIRSNNNHNY